MKLGKRLAAIMLCCFALTGGAAASNAAAVEEALPEEAREILGDVTVSHASDAGALLDKIWRWTADTVGAKIRQAAKSAVTALAVTLLCSAAGAASPDGKTPKFVVLGSAVAVTAACAGSVSSYLAQARDALAGLCDFSKALLPCIAAASAASGHAASGAARYAASSLFMDLLLSVGTGVVLPLICAFTAAAAANAALPGGGMGGPARLIKWLCGTVLAALTTAFTLYMTLSGAVSGSADAVARGLAKSAIGAALPVVGSIIADAADAYLAGAQLLRGAVGAVGLAAVLCVCIGPFLGLGAHYLLFKAAACVAEPFAEGSLSELLSDIGSAYGMALGLLGSAGAMLFVSIVLGAQLLTGG